MSPALQAGFLTVDGFPRVSGDEPLGTTAAVGVGAFSPRERG